MSKFKLCGHDVTLLLGRDSPFSQVVFVGYDDGPTSGAAQCRANAETYRFELLDKDVDGRYDRDAWDRGEEIRIFGLAELPGPAFHRLNAMLSHMGSRAKMAQDPAYFEDVRSNLDAASPPSLVIATHGIATSIIAAREVSTEELASVQDWFAFLAIAPQTGNRD